MFEMNNPVARFNLDKFVMEETANMNFYFKSVSK